MNGEISPMRTSWKLLIFKIHLYFYDFNRTIKHRKFQPYYIGSVPSDFKIEKDTILNIAEEVRNGDIKEMYGIDVSFDTNSPKGKDGWWREKEAMKKQWEEKGIDPKKVIRMG